jgi:hypothetical protein
LSPLRRISGILSVIPLFGSLSRNRFHMLPLPLAAHTFSSTVEMPDYAKLAMYILTAIRSNTPPDRNANVAAHPTIFDITSRERKSVDRVDKYDHIDNFRALGELFAKYALSSSFEWALSELKSIPKGSQRNSQQEP